MSTGRRELRLPLPPEVALEACRRVVRELGWTIESEGDRRLRSSEDLAMLNCYTWPTEVEIAVRQGAGDETVVTLDASTPGRGPLSSQNLRVRLDALAGRLAKAGKGA